jgi:hypothetical protein
VGAGFTSLIAASLEAAEVGLKWRLSKLAAAIGGRAGTNGGALCCHRDAGNDRD